MDARLRLIDIAAFPAMPKLTGHIMNRRLILLELHIAALLAGFTGLFGKLLTCRQCVRYRGRADAYCRSRSRHCRGLSPYRSAHTQPAGFFVLPAHLRRIAGCPLACIFYSIQVSTVAIGLLGFSSYPLFVTLLEPIFFKEKWKVGDLFIALAAAAGLALIVPKFDFHQNLTRGLLWGIVTALTCAAFSLITRSCAREYPALMVVFYQQVAAALFSLPAMLLASPSGNGRTYLLLITLGVVFTAGLQMLLIINCLAYPGAHGKRGIRAGASLRHRVGRIFSWRDPLPSHHRRRHHCFDNGVLGKFPARCGAGAVTGIASLQRWAARVNQWIIPWTGKNCSTVISWMPARG